MNTSSHCNQHLDNYTLRLTEHTLWFKDSFRERSNASGPARITSKLFPPEVLSNYEEQLQVEWVAALCPDVIQHYKRVPYFTRSSQGMPVVLTTAAAMTQTCLLRVVDAAARRVGAKWFVYAGGHLGAALHGGPIPWDDDVDVLVEIQKVDEFTNELSSFALPGGARLSVVKTNQTLHGEVKLSIIGNPLVQNFPSKHFIRKHIKVPPLTWPFVDIFFYTTNGTHLYEVNQRRVPTRERGSSYGGQRYMPNARGGPVWETSVFFPSRSYLYGGLTLPGPSVEVAKRRYNYDICRTSGFTHRLNLVSHLLPPEMQYNTTRLDCCRLRPHLPFIRHSKLTEDLVVGDRVIHTAQLSPEGQIISRFYHEPDGGRLYMATHVDPWTQLTLDLPQSAWNTSAAEALWDVSAAQRETWRAVPTPSSGPRLSEQIPHLDATEIDNSIAPLASCRALGEGRNKSLRVLQFNAERGRNWFLLALMMRSVSALEADLLLLNEMDIGMARSGNVHTTRMLAHALGYNYAWALEFVELTRGTHDEQNATLGANNTMGLHGNAILSRCPLRNAQVVRDVLATGYFSDAPTSVNARGFEKRLGGRLALIAEVHIPRETPSSASSTHVITAGAVHKLATPPKLHAMSEILGTNKRVRTQSSSAHDVVVAGDLAGTFKFCSRVGLTAHGNKASKGFPASCTTPGSMKGDYFCSNLREGHREETHLPCYRQWNEGSVLSDHAITTLVLNLS
jgi:endonuclease/exonuclease/phosphatase family metal-dependent hydrolase